MSMSSANTFTRAQPTAFGSMPAALRAAMSLICVCVCVHMCVCACAALKAAMSLICVCVCVCVCVRVCVCMCSLESSYVVDLRVCACVCACVCMRMCEHLCVRICVMDLYPVAPASGNGCLTASRPPLLYARGGSTTFAL